MFGIKLPAWVRKLFGLEPVSTSGTLVHTNRNVLVPHILEFASFCHIGTRRTNNEDRVFINPTRRVFVVLDGMGGLQAGEVASATAAKAFEEGTALGGIFPGVAEAAPSLQQMALAAHRSIRDAAGSDPNLFRMGTTVTGAAVTATLDLQLVHAGDSRAYLLRGGELRRLTEDDTVVAALVRAQLITEVQAKGHPMRNELSCFLGQEDLSDVGLPPSVTLMPGDTVLLCTDGLLILSEAEIGAILSLDQSAQKSCEQLLRRALEAKARDNVSAIVIRIIAVNEKLDGRPQ